MRRLLSLLFTLALLAGAIGVGVAPVAARTTASVSVSVPGTAIRGEVTAVRLTLPANIAALDGRLLLPRGAAKLIGVAIFGGGTGLRPVAVTGGYAFGAYNLKATGSRVVVDLVVLPRKSGSLQARVIVDSTATSGGRRAILAGTDRVTGISVGGSSRHLLAAPAGARPEPSAIAQDARELVADGRINKRDLDAARAAWETARATNRVCGSGLGSDVNQDGCVDIVDVQATIASLGRRTGVSTVRLASTGGRTFTVTSTADTVDAAPGNGICADASGRCTLRAAMAEADYLKGDDRIEFNLAGSAPVLIQIGSRLPMIASKAGTVTIDGYSQPGASVNTASAGSNAVPGVEIRGNGNSAREVGLFITSPGNTVRGLVLNNLWRGMVLDSVNAHDNRILGNWLGFRGSGTNSASGQYGMVLNVGAHDNVIGTANRADRNVLGNWQAAIDEYGPGVDGNVIKGNQFCIRPSGIATATCGTAVDHNFGPKNGVIGGDDPGEANIIGPTSLQGIELSHGYDPAHVDTTTKYQINGNRITGNWVGFRGDGSYDPAFRSGLNLSTADNGQGINVYDGVYDNIVQRNYIGSVYDGIQVMGSNAQRNIVRGNIIGVSPLGQNAPLSGWGIVVRWSTKYDVIQNNTIRNATKGGVALLKTNASGASQAPAFNIRISRNIVSDTTGTAIDLLGVAGPDPNDAGDADTGANTLLNSPVIASASTALVTGTSNKNATVEIYRASRLAGSYGLPVEFLGDAVAATDGTWSVPMSTIQAGERITALQIRGDGNTSELAANVIVSQAPPPPGPGDLIAGDDFNRTVASGWGTASNGPAWTDAGSTADFSVAGDRGQIAVAAGQTREGRLPVGMTDVTVSGLLTFDRLPSSGNVYAYVLARQNGNSAYRATIRMNAAGAIFVQLKKALSNVESSVGSEVATGVTVAPSTALAFRFRLSGSDLRFRAWDATGAEPDWQVTAIDTSLTSAGGVGLRALVGSPVPNGPVTFTLDDLEARIPQ